MFDNNKTLIELEFSTRSFENYPVVMRLMCLE